MDAYFRIVGLLLISSLLILVIQRKEKEIAMVFSICVLLLSGFTVVEFMKPILVFWNDLASVGGFSEEYIGILLRITGICLISQISVSVCTDIGNNTLGKVIVILTNIMILYLGIPVFRSVLSIIQEILGKV